MLAERSYEAWHCLRTFPPTILPASGKTTKLGYPALPSLALDLAVVVERKKLSDRERRLVSWTIHQTPSPTAKL